MTKMDWERANQRDRMRKWRDQPRSRPLARRASQCAGTTRAGLACRGKAKAGHHLCGPHLEQSKAAAERRIPR